LGKQPPSFPNVIFDLYDRTAPNEIKTIEILDNIPHPEKIMHDPLQRSQQRDFLVAQSQLPNSQPASVASESAR